MKVKITRKGDTRIFTGVKTLRQVPKDDLLTDVYIRFNYTGAMTCSERGNGGYVGSISMNIKPDEVLSMHDCEKIEFFADDDNTDKKHLLAELVRVMSESDYRLYPRSWIIALVATAYARVQAQVEIDRIHRETKECEEDAC